MRKLKLLMVAFMAMCGLSVNAADKVVGERFTTIADLDGKLFAVVDESTSKAMGFGISGHGSSWDMYFGTYNEAYASNACYLKIAAASDGYCYLHTYNSAGNLYNISWASGGYFNSQPANKDVCFALGKDQDGVDLSVWSIEVSEGKFALKNKGTGLYLHNDSKPAKYEDPFYFTFCTLIDDPLPAVQEKYDALKTKYLAINASLDVTEAEALYNGATTVDEVQAAIDKLVSTFGASLANETSLTGLIINPSFESGFTGWVNNGMATQNNSSFPGKVGTYYCEVWQPNGTKGVSQTLTLPQGLYSMSANSLARGVTSAKLYAGSKEKALTIADGSNTYDVEFYVSGGGDVTVGFEGVGTGAGNSWLCVDNFQLTYVQNMTAEGYAAYEASKAYEVALAAAKALIGKVPAKANLSVQQVIDQNTLTGGTADEYNDATAALNAVVEAVQPLVAPYATWLALEASANAIAAVEYTETTSGSHATFVSAITDQTSAVDNATTAADITAATTALKNAIRTYINAAEPTAPNKFEITCLVENPSFDDNTITGWTRTNTSGGNAQTTWTCNEFWNNTFDFYQELTGLPNGSYQLSVQAFSRPGDNNVAYPEYAGGTNSVTAELYVNNDASTVGNIYAYTGNTIGTKVTTGDWQEDYKCVVEGGTDYWVPNCMESSSYYFADENVYKTTVAALVEDGNLRIGFRDETLTESQWTIFDNFRLYYYGSDKSVYYAQYLPQLVAEVEADKSNALYANVTGKELSDLNTALGVDASSFTTEEEYSNAIQTIKDAQTAYRAAYPSYDALVAARAYTAPTEITSNIGTGVFQYPANTPDLWDEYSSAKSAVDASITSESTAATVQALVDALDDAIETYNAITLNDPDPSKRYYLNIIDDGKDWDGNAITFVAGGRIGEGDYNVQYLASANANLCQALKFTAVEGSANTYHISAVRPDGDEQYLTTKLLGYEVGAHGQLRTTSDATKAAPVKIQATTTNGQFKLLNVLADNAVIARNATNPDNGVFTDGDANFTIAEASKASVDVNIDADVKYGTRIFPFTPELPAGVKAYTISVNEENEDVLDLTEVSEPEANVPYIVYAENGYSGASLENWGIAAMTSYPVGLLTGTYVRLEKDALDGNYILQKHDGDVTPAFYRVDATLDVDPYLAPNRCYLTDTNNSSKLRFSFGEEDATAINGLEVLTSGKYDAIYNAAGVKVNALQKGMNIIQKGGKSYKIFVK